MGILRSECVDDTVSMNVGILDVLLDLDVIGNHGCIFKIKTDIELGSTSILCGILDNGKYQKLANEVIVTIRLANVLSPQDMNLLLEIRLQQSHQVFVQHLRILFNTRVRTRNPLRISVEVGLRQHPILLSEVMSVTVSVVNHEINVSFVTSIAYVIQKIWKEGVSTI